MPDLDSQNLEKLKDLADSLITSVRTKSNIYCKIFRLVQRLAVSSRLWIPHKPCPYFNKSGGLNGSF